MSKSKIRIALVSLLVSLSLPVWAQVEGHPCNPAIPETTPSTRLIDNSDGTVTDTKTGLMWKQCAEGLSGSDCATGDTQSYTWQAALAQAQTVNTGGGFAGYTDWRLPNIKELRSIVERHCYAPAINLERFPNTDDADFWSASPSASGDYAGYVGFDDGYDVWVYKGNAFQVRLVRRGSDGSGE